MKEETFKKIFKITLFTCLIILLTEIIYFGYKKYKFEKENIFYDNYNMTIKDGDDILSVGSSFFKYSKKNDYTGGYEKGKFVKLDKNGKEVFEIKYDKGFNSTFTSILIADDAYYVTGHGDFSKEQIELRVRDAFLIKYDKNGNKIWEKYYGVLKDTRFTNSILTDDGIVVIGRSIYEPMEVGNHQTGGGIIVKYDFDGNELWHNNHGGNKSGQFNDIVEVNNDFYVTGKDGADSGNIVKFTKDGKYKWHKNFSFTDEKGHQGITYFNNLLYIVSSKKILKDEDEEKRITKDTQGLILVYDLKGNKKDEILIGGNKLERLTDIVSDKENIYITGVSSSQDKTFNIKLNKPKENDTYYSGIVLKYDKNLKLKDKIVLGGMNNDMLNSITIIDNNLYISGLSNSKDGNIKTKESNGKDFFGKIIEINKENLEYKVIK